MPESASLSDPGTTHAESLTRPREWPSFLPGTGRENVMTDTAQPDYPRPPLPPQQQDRRPGLTAPMDPQPDHGESTYRGNNRLADKIALITGADSGIGRAVAIAYAREGADVALGYLPEEEEDAAQTEHWVRETGRKVLQIPADLSLEQNCRDTVAKAVSEFGHIDLLV